MKNSTVQLDSPQRPLWVIRCSAAAAAAAGHPWHCGWTAQCSQNTEAPGSLPEEPRTGSWTSAANGRQRFDLNLQVETSASSCSAHQSWMSSLGSGSSCSHWPMDHTLATPWSLLWGRSLQQRKKLKTKRTQTWWLNVSANTINWIMEY